MILFGIQNIPADVTRDFRGRPLLTFFGTSANFSVFYFLIRYEYFPLGQGELNMKAAIL